MFIDWSIKKKTQHGRYINDPSYDDTCRRRFFAAGPAFAECNSVTFSDVGWTDITATTAVATTLLDALGYNTNTLVLSVPVTYTSMANGDVDVFLGNWMPTMEADIAPLS